MQVLHRDGLQLELGAVGLALGAVGQARDGLVVHRGDDVELDVLVVVVEQRGVGVEAAVEPFRLEAQLVAGQVFRIDRRHRGLVDRAGVVAAGAEAIGIAEVHPGVVGEAVFRGQVVGPVAPGVAVVLHGVDHQRRGDVADLPPVAAAEVGLALVLQAAQVDVLGLAGPAQAGGEVEVVGEAVGGAAEQRVALGALVVRAVVVRARDVRVGQRGVGAFRVEVLVEVVEAEHPVQAVLARRGQAQLLRPLLAVDVAVAALQFQRGVVAVADAFALEVLEGGDRGQLQAAELPGEVEVGADLVDVDLVLGVVVDLALLRVDGVAELVGAVRAQAVAHRAVAAGVVVAAGVDVEVGFQVVVDPREELQAHGIVFQGALVVVVVEVLVVAVAALVAERQARGQAVVDQRVADRAFQHAVGVVAEAGLEVAGRVEGRLARDEVYRAGGGVLAPQRALRAAQHLDALLVEQREAAGADVGDVHVVDVDAHRTHGVGVLVAGAEAADPPARPAVAFGGAGRGVGNELGHFVGRLQRGVADLVAAQHGDRGGHFLHGLLALLRGHRDLGQGRRAAGRLLAGWRLLGARHGGCRLGGVTCDEIGAGQAPQGPGDGGG
ncbi:hypothetical protein D9M68_360690 [compost metagenome]